MKCVFAMFFLALAALIPASAVQPSFILSDLSEGDVLLFGARADQPGWGEFNTLLSADLSDGDAIKTLSHFPERARYFSATGELEIQNRYGLYRIPISRPGAIRLMAFHPSFSNGSSIPVGRILPLSSSPDGKWTLVQEPVTPVRGRLVLHNTITGARNVIAENQVLDYRNAPALWSPDSRLLMYSRNGRLYHASVHHVEEDRLPDESYREFGEGTLSSVKWTGEDSLYYVVDNKVKLIRPSVFFTRSFYNDPLPAGSTVGEIPMDFDPHFDEFWPSPDGKTLMLLTEGRSLFLFPLSDTSDETAASLPFMVLPRDTTVLQMWWMDNGGIRLLCGGSLRGSTPSRLYVLDPWSDEGSEFRPVDLEGIRRFVPSPDRSRVAVLGSDGFSLASPLDFTLNESFVFDDPRDLFWIDDDTVLVTGSSTTMTISLETGKGSILALSSFEKAGFGYDGSIYAVSDGRRYIREHTKNEWMLLEGNPSDGYRPPRLESPIHRVYTEESRDGYANSIRIRTVGGFGNRILVNGPYAGIEAPDDSDMANEIAVESPVVFEHGSRSQGRMVSLVFNAIDGDEGLGEVLAVLDDYGIRTTFFVSGDFIRRNRSSAAALAESEHEIGSLFYTHMDMTDFRYRVDSDFVVRGLGRHEDEYFRATGKEVSTLWHAPWYVVSPPILEATNRMGYRYIGRDIDPMDWVTMDGEIETYRLYKKSAELVEDVLESAAPGSIIPIRVGKPGKRSDYFFRKLDLLINGLLKADYDIVSVSVLMENSR